MLTLHFTKKLQFTLREKCSMRTFFWSEYRKIQKNDALQSQALLSTAENAHIRGLPLVI